MIERIINWFNIEPAVSMLMVTTAIILFGSTFQAAKGFDEKTQEA